MVESIVGGVAALCAATSLQSQKALHVPNDPPTSLKSGEHVRVQTERRRATRAAVTGSSTLDSLRPMLERAKTDAALSEAKSLLDVAEKELRSGRNEQALLTLDGATLRLNSASKGTGSNLQFLDVFHDLEQREDSLRQKLGQPSVLPFDPNKTAKDEAPAADKPVEVPKRDELPVG